MGPFQRPIIIIIFFGFLSHVLLQEGRPEVTARADGMSPLHLAVAKGDAAEVRRLLEPSGAAREMLACSGVIGFRPLAFESRERLHAEQL